MPDATISANEPGGQMSGTHDPTSDSAGVLC
jgi:hypothetical protein